ncbi:unnamed protein product, partial [Discosporangium mesarthrocarpum]
MRVESAIDPEGRGAGAITGPEGEAMLMTAENSPPDSPPVAVSGGSVGDPYGPTQRVSLHGGSVSGRRHTAVVNHGSPAEAQVTSVGLRDGSLSPRGGRGMPASFSASNAVVLAQDGAGESGYDTVPLPSQSTPPRNDQMHATRRLPGSGPRATHIRSRSSSSTSSINSASSAQSTGSVSSTMAQAPTSPPPRGMALTPSKINSGSRRGSRSSRGIESPAGDIPTANPLEGGGDTWADPRSAPRRLGEELSPPRGFQGRAESPPPSDIAMGVGVGRRSLEEGARSPVFTGEG